MQLKCMNVFCAFVVFSYLLCFCDLELKFKKKLVKLFLSIE